MRFCTLIPYRLYLRHHKIFHYRRGYLQRLPVQLELWVYYEFFIISSSTCRLLHRHYFHSGEEAAFYIVIIISLRVGGSIQIISRQENTIEGKELYISGQRSPVVFL